MTGLAAHPADSMVGPVSPRGVVEAWSPEHLPDQSGRRIVITGVTSGIGRLLALELARSGASVVLAARSPVKLDATEAQIRAAAPGARLERALVDLADLTSVRRAAREVAGGGPVHTLVNNAGVMALPHRRTVDGFEAQLATNHLGPFALTGLLLPQLVGSGDGLVVSTGSLAHRFALRAPLQDPRIPPQRYSRWGAYAGSKLADLMFALELDDRLRARGLPVRSVAAHPGYAATGLMHHDPSAPARARERLLAVFFPLLGQPARAGALPTLCAATADLPGGSYVGPGGPAQLRGRPRLVGMRRLARDPAARRRLWELSERATGVAYP